MWDHPTYGIDVTSAVLRESPMPRKPPDQFYVVVCISEYRTPLYNDVFLRFILTLHHLHF